MSERYCKDCASDPGLATRNRPAPHPGPRCTTHHRVWQRVKKAERHEAHVQRTYGLAPGEYERLLDYQGGVCAICLKPPRGGKLVVDHCHRTGRVRGLIHAQENYKLLGWFAKDDPAYLDRAASYLRYPPYWRMMDEDV